MAAASDEPLMIDWIVSPQGLWRFFTLVRSGFRVRTVLPCPLRQLLCDRLGIPVDYVRDRVQTVFLNGRAVDDIDAATVADGDVVTLSAAMPGLVGATLRKGGRLTSLRSSLSHRPAPPPVIPEHPGDVTVKFFNLICADLAPAFLENGLLLPAETIRSFLADNRKDLAPSGPAVRVNGRSVSLSDLDARLAAGGQARLTVRTDLLPR